MPGRKTYIVGIGKTKYEKPRNRIGYEELGLQAATKALLDAGIKWVRAQQTSPLLADSPYFSYDEVQQAYVGCE
jgi:hypothetical protein